MNTTISVVMPAYNAGTRINDAITSVLRQSRWWPVDKLAQCADILESDRVMFLLGDLQRALPGDPPTAYLPRNSTFFPRSRRFIQREAAWQSSEDCYLLLPPAGLDLFLAGFPPYPSTFVIRKTALNDVGGAGMPGSGAARISTLPCGWHASIPYTM